MTIEELEQRRAARKDPRDLPHTTTRAEVDTYVADTAALDRRILQAGNATATLAALGSAEDDERWRDLLIAARDTLCGELLSLKSPIRDAHTLGVQANLTLSIRIIDFGLKVIKDSGYDLLTLKLGELMRAAGYAPQGADPDRNFSGTMPWFGSLPEVEKRIGALAARREQAQAALDDALMDDAERAERDAAAKARRDALNALPTRKTRGDGSQFDKFPDGRRVEVSG